MKPLRNVAINIFILFSLVNGKAQSVMARNYDCSYIRTSYNPYLNIFTPSTNYAADSIDLNRDNIKDFVISRRSFYGGNYASRSSSIRPIGQNEVAFNYSDTIMADCSPYPSYPTSLRKDLPKVFQRNDPIDNNLIWKNGELFFDYWESNNLCYYYIKHQVYFTANDTVTLGLRILTGNDTLYGWINIRTITASYFQMYDMACKLPPSGIQPVIFQNGNILTSNYSYGNQWLLNNVPITGATSQTYTFTQNGNYSLIINYNDSCLSDTSSVIITDVSVKENSFNIIQISPNPSHDKIYVTLNSKIINNNWELYNHTGQLVLNGHFKEENETIINLENISSGLYFLRINQHTIKIIRE